MLVLQELDSDFQRFEVLWKKKSRLGTVRLIEEKSTVTLRKQSMEMSKAALI